MALHKRLVSSHLVAISTMVSCINADAFKHLFAVSLLIVYVDGNGKKAADHNSLLIYGSLRTPTMDRFAQVTHYSTFVSMLACMAVALAGFVTFGDKTMGNVLVKVSNVHVSANS